MGDNQSSSERKPYLKKEEVEWAEKFLEESNLGNRLNATEALLITFAKGDKYKKTKQWLMNLKFNLRQIADSEFSHLIKEDNSTLDQLLKKSKGAAHMRVQESAKSGSMTFYLFYEKGLGQEEYYFQSQCFGQAVAAIMSMMQFDMSGFQGDQSIKMQVANSANQKIQEQLNEGNQD